MCDFLTLFNKRAIFWNNTLEIVNVCTLTKGAVMRNNMRKARFTKAIKNVFSNKYLEWEGANLLIYAN